MDANAAPVGISFLPIEAANNPLNSWATLITTCPQANYKQQIYTPWFNNSRVIYFRVYDYDGWKSWSLIPSTSLGDPLGVTNTNLAWTAASGRQNDCTTVHYDGRAFIYVDGNKLYLT